MTSVLRTPKVIGGFLEEDGELWDCDGRLVAISRQLAMVGVPQKAATAPSKL